jgi:hypothetical protein
MLVFFVVVRTMLNMYWIVGCYAYSVLWWDQWLKIILQSLDCLISLSQVFGQSIISNFLIECAYKYLGTITIEHVKSLLIELILCMMVSEIQNMGYLWVWFGSCSTSCTSALHFLLLLSCIVTSMRLQVHMECIMVEWEYRIIYVWIWYGLIFFIFMW